MVWHSWRICHWRRIWLLDFDKHVTEEDSVRDSVKREKKDTVKRPIVIYQVNAMNNTNSKFYGITLDKETDSITWDSFADNDPRCHKLVIKQLLLGVEAAEDEYNVVEVSTAKDIVKIPLAVLRAGELRVVNPNMEFYESTLTFKLIQGKGPVHIFGEDIKDDNDVVYVKNDFMDSEYSDE